MRVRLIVHAGALALGLFGVSHLASAADTCEWAHDSVCDEARYGGAGDCADGTDSADCKLAASGNNSCNYAWDGECDDPGLGTGACRAGSDETDCRSLLAGGDDSCQWARDGECDEHGHIGTGNCTDGTDVTDCAALYDMRNRDNSCTTLFDGVCDEPDIGTGSCEARTDTVDCLGRDTVPGIQDYFFGHDDRILIDPSTMPWSAMGEIQFNDDSACTGTLVSPRVVLTAAHCLFAEDGETTARPLRFRAGLDGYTSLADSEIAEWKVAPGYPEASEEGDEGHDWAFVLLKRDLGTQLGMLDVYPFGPKDVARVRSGTFPPVSHGGYPWDAASRMLGHIGCEIVAARDDNSILHECDTTQGDSGSAIFIADGDRYSVIAVDSEFFDDDNGNPTGLAVDSRAFAAALASYIALKDPPR